MKDLSELFAEREADLVAHHEANRAKIDAEIAESIKKGKRELRRKRKAGAVERPKKIAP